MPEDTGRSKEGEQPPQAIGQRSTVGKSLKRLFGQDDSLERVEEQRATSSVLMNPARLSIFVHLCMNACDHERSIARSLDMNNNVVSWHLRSLVAGGMVETAGESGKRLYWPAGLVKPEDSAMIGMMRGGPGLRTVKAIVACGGIASQADIARVCRCSRQTAGARLSVLARAGAIERSGAGREVRFSVSGKALEAASRYRESSRDASRRLLEMLDADGLQPRNPRLRGYVLRVTVALPSGRSRVALCCNPMSFLERLMRKRV